MPPADALPPYAEVRDRLRVLGQRYVGIHTILVYTSEFRSAIDAIRAAGLVGRHAHKSNGDLYLCVNSKLRARQRRSLLPPAESSSAEATPDARPH